MDSDVLCPAACVRRLVPSPHPNVLLVDEIARQDSEERMAIIRGGRVVAMTKKVPNEPPGLIGEGVGFIKINREDARAMLAAMEPFVQKGELDMEYEDTWEAFFRAVPVSCEKIGGEPWEQIAFPEELVRPARGERPRVQEAPGADARTKFH